MKSSLEAPPELLRYELRVDCESARGLRVEARLRVEAASRLRVDCESRGVSRDICESSL